MHESKSTCGEYHTRYSLRYGMLQLSRDVAGADGYVSCLVTRLFRSLKLSRFVNTRHYRLVELCRSVSRFGIPSVFSVGIESLRNTRIPHDLLC